MLVIQIKGKGGETMRVVWNGEFVCPKEGEWLKLSSREFTIADTYFGKVVQVTHLLVISPTPNSEQIQEISIDLG